MKNIAEDFIISRSTVQKNEINIRIKFSGTKISITHYLLCTDDKLGPAIPFWALVSLLKGDMVRFPATVFVVKPESLSAYPFF